MAQAETFLPQSTSCKSKLSADGAPHSTNVFDVSVQLCAHLRESTDREGTTEIVPFMSVGSLQDGPGCDLRDVKPHPYFARVCVRACVCVCVYSSTLLACVQSFILTEKKAWLTVAGD